MTRASPIPSSARAARDRSSTPIAGTARAAAICRWSRNDGSGNAGSGRAAGGARGAGRPTPPHPPHSPARNPLPATRWFSGFQFRKPTRRTVFRTISWTVGVGFVLFLALGFWAYRAAVGRFEVRRLRLPTRIYADYMPLTEGAPLQLDDLLEKLDRLGYRDVDKVAQAGDYARNADGVDIFTRAFRHPTGDYPSQRVHAVITKSQIDSVSAE